MGFLSPCEIDAASGPSITTQPQSQSVLAGANAGFTVVAGGQTPLFYQWSLNGAHLTNNTHLSGTTNSTLTLSNVVAGDAGNYQVVVSNSHGSVASSNAVLTVLLPPFIIFQPSNQVAMLSSNASLTVVAGGTSPLRYQWYFDGAAVTNGGRISGAMTASLNIANVQLADFGFYQVVVTNNYGGVTSVAAVLGTSPGAPGVVRFVSSSSSSPAAPYTDWSIAATNIQDAVDTSKDGDFILVTNGVYSSAGRASSDGTTNCVVVTNAATVQSVNGPSVTLINGSNVLRCASLSNGAALIGFTLTNGSAGNGGGANGGRLDSCFIVGNSGGGAYYSVLNNCTVISNSAIGVGYCTLSNCVVSGNTGSGAGGSTLTQCVIQNNNASGWQGGGANICTLNNCLLSGNLATSGGGASSSTLNNCFLRNNSASWGGGAISSTLNNCLVAANLAHNHYVDFYAASLGGGVWGGTANNCTIVGNAVVADENSSGRDFSGGGAYGTALNNCIVYFNSEGPYTHDSSYNYGGGTLSNCCTTPLASGSGNFTSDPLLVDFNGGDYHLQTNSPCINAGNNAYAVGATDLDGNPRTVGLVVDAGAYELQWPTYFTVQPQSQSVNFGQTVVFSAAATGPLPFIYQWLLNGAAISGATNSTLTLTNVQLADDGGYSIMVSNATVTVFSTNAVLSVLYPPPGILSQPTNLTVLVGTTAQFSVTVTSLVTVAYQWLLNGTTLVDGGSISGSTNSVLNISGAQGTDAGNYQVIVMNNFGAVTSAVATLTVLVPANIVTQPVSQSVLLSNNVTFAATAAGTASLSYQWYFNGAPLSDGGRITGSAAPSLSISTVGTNDAGSYQLVVTNNYGAGTSQLATLTVLIPPIIVGQPTNLTVQPGSNATFIVTVTGPGPLSYQWLFNGANLIDGGRISGSTTPTLTVQNCQATDNGSYQVIVTNINGMAASVPANLNVLAPPVITKQPSNLFEPLNGAASMTAAAAGGAPLSYQWYFNGVPMSDNGRINGSLTPGLRLAHLQTNDQGSYQMLATNAYGSATSSVASLTVLRTPVSSAGSVVYGWGRDDVGQTDVPGDATNIVSIAAGYIHVLALRIDGTVEAWGESYLGATSVPAGLSNVVALAGGDNHSLALKSDGTVVAWGYNGYGEANVPTGLSNVVAIAAGNFFSLALKRDGTVTGWGDNGNSQLSEAGSAGSIVAIAANPVNTGYAMGLKADGTVVEWGGYIPPMPSGLTNLVQIAVGGAHYLALKGGGTVVAWGDNGSGQTNVPAGLSNVVAIAAGSTVSLALKADGTVVVWGDSTSADGINPFGLTNVTAIASGGGSNLVLNNGTPSLSAWPTNQAVYTGMPAAFNAAVVPGPVPVSLQWQFNGTNLPGANGSSLSLTNVQMMDAGTYSLLVTNVYGAVTSSALLTVTTSAPTIVQQPTDQVVPAASNATFTATAIGSWPLSYQWQCSDTNIPGATNSTLVVTNAQLNQAGRSFDVVVTNTLGLAVSSNATLNVVPALVGIQPQNLMTNGGATVTFSSTVVGQGPFSYQWQYYGTNVAGATNSTLTLTNSLASQSGPYSVIASNSFGSAVSSSAMLTVVPWIIVSISPNTITSGAGTLVIFSFKVGGLSPVTYQWTQNGNPFAGPNPGGALDIINPPVSWAGTYNVTASDAYATVTSSNVTLTIIPLAIANQPQSRGAWVGSAAQLKVSAIGAPPLGYQWQFYGTNIPGANASLLTLTNVQAWQFGPYDVVVTNPYTNRVSSTAVLALSQVAVWGSASDGETNLPTSLTNIIAISGGGSELPDCEALKSDGTVVMWPGTGIGFYSQGATNLIAIAGASPGFGLRPNGNVIEWPLYGSGIIAGLSNVVAISAAGGSYLALKANGTVSLNPAVAGSPAGLSNVVAVAQGGGHSLALKPDGTLMAWGNNAYGQATVPLGQSNVVAIAAGGYHSLALKGDGTLAGWGLNSYGQAHIPGGLSNVVAIAAGTYHSLALKADGTVAAWGFNANGQTNVPPGLTNVIAIAAGLYQSMALIGNGPPAAQALATNPNLDANGFSLALPTRSGRVYLLEYKNSLSDSNWTFLPLIPGNGGTMLLADPTATNAQRFYQVRRW
ncbi:MAG TPA: immunoglobulin domain-containing protein [Candidatus Acidoferrum sp.]|nr:immunoglobulin domain-containing protein [Candidatus Acidoferrum sp.]